MKPAKIPETQFCASRVRRAPMPGDSHFSFRRVGEAIKRVLNRFYRVSCWNQVTAGNPLFASAAKNALNLTLTATLTIPIYG